MFRKWTIIISSAALIIIGSSMFGSYITCRNAITDAKIAGYDIWRYTGTRPLIFESWVFFSDGTNTLSCGATGFGPFWIKKNIFMTALGTYKELRYYGVSP